MSFGDVYYALQEVFPKIDNRILRAVAIEHPDDLTTAFHYVLDEVLPHASRKSVSFIIPQPRESQQTAGKTAERVVFEWPSMTTQNHMGVGSTDAGSSSASGSHFFRNGNHMPDLNDPVLFDKDDDNDNYDDTEDCSDSETALTRSPGKRIDSNVNGGPTFTTSVTSLVSMQGPNAGVCGSSGVQQDGYDWSALSNLNTVTSQKSYEETSLDSALVDVEHSLAQLVFTYDHEAEQDTFTCAQKEDSPLDNAPLEVALSVVERALCSDDEDTPDQDALDCSITSLNDYSVIVTESEKPEATYSVDLNVYQASSVGEMHDDRDESMSNTSLTRSHNDYGVVVPQCEKPEATYSVDLNMSVASSVGEMLDNYESMLNSSLTRSQEICSVNFLEDIIEDAKNNKSTLFNAMDSLITTMREVEQKEKEAEEAKEEAGRAGERTLSESEDLKKMLQQANDVNDKHAGEVYGEKGILATEARELQSRLLCLSDERDTSLAILNELNISLQARLALAKEEIAAAEMEKLQKEQAAEEKLTEQKFVMEKVVEESRKLQHEAEENSKLRDFLMDRGHVVDILQGEISVICQDVRLLKEKFDARVPLSKSVSSSQTTCRLASSNSSVKSAVSVHSLDQFQFTESPKKSPSTDEQSQKSSSSVHNNNKDVFSAYNGGWDDGWDLLENGDDL